MGHAVGTRPGSFCALSAFPPPRLGEPVREVHSEVSEVCSSDLTETCSRSMDFPFVEKPGMARRSFSWVRINVRSGSGAWTRTKILGSKGPCATNCTTPEQRLLWIALNTQA